jgi:hypothetical protein
MISSDDNNVDKCVLPSPDKSATALHHYHTKRNVCYRRIEAGVTALLDFIDSHRRPPIPPALMVSVWVAVEIRTGFL